MHLQGSSHAIMGDTGKVQGAVDGWKDGLDRLIVCIGRHERGLGLITLDGFGQVFETGERLDFNLTLFEIGIFFWSDTLLRIL